MNYGDTVNDFLVEVRERGGFANDRNFDLIVGQVFYDKLTAAIDEEREACARLVELPTFIGLDDLAKAIRARKSKGDCLMTPVNVSEDNLAARAIEALENIKGVLAAITRGQRVSMDRGEESLLLFNWLFGGHPYKDTGILLEAAKRKVEEEREACAAIVHEEYKKWEDEGFKVHQCFRDAEKRIRARSEATNR